MQQITFDEPKLKRLKESYQQAIKDKKDSFIFEGHELLTSYAKYMIEYLEDKFKKQ